MKIPKACKIELAASQDASRYVIAHPTYDAKASALVATNGCILAVVPVTPDENDTPGPIACKALAAARKLCRKRDERATLTAEATRHALPDGSALPRPEPVNYPNWRQVVPGPENYAGGLVLHLDAHELRNLADALGSERVALHLNAKTPQSGVIRVVPYGRGAVAGAYGVIMPHNPVNL